VDRKQHFSSDVVLWPLPTKSAVYRLAHGNDVIVYLPVVVYQRILAGFSARANSKYATTYIT
jgi:hypothetical protein